jgi:hypothetical protein
MAEIDGEKVALGDFLGFQRASVRAILADLDEASLRKRVLPSGWTPLGLVEHLGHAERHWFQEVFVGSAPPLPWPDEHSPLVTTRSPDQVFGFYAEQCRISDEIIAGTPLTAAPAGRHPDDVLAAQTTDLRRIILHVIEETARHAGHLDVARELLDGRTGLGPR